MAIPAMAAKSMFLLVQAIAVAANKLALQAKTALRSAIPVLAACFALSHLPTAMVIPTAAAKSTLQSIHITAAPAVQPVQPTYQTAPPTASIQCAAYNARPALRIAMQFYLMVVRRQSLLTFITVAGAASLVRQESMELRSARLQLVVSRVLLDLQTATAISPTAVRSIRPMTSTIAALVAIYARLLMAARPVRMGTAALYVILASGTATTMQLKDVRRIWQLIYLIAVAVGML